MKRVQKRIARWGLWCVGERCAKKGERGIALSRARVQKVREAVMERPMQAKKEGRKVRRSWEVLVGWIVLVFCGEVA